MKRLSTCIRQTVLYRTKFRPAILSCALTGTLPTKSMNPYVPTTPEEIGEDAIKVYHAGASVVHIHVRDDDEKHTHDISKYMEVVKQIKQHEPDLIINLTTGGRSVEQEDRLTGVRMKPEMCSFTTGSNNLGKVCFDNNPDFLFELAQCFQENDVKPELECFEVGHITNAIFLAEKGLLTKPLNFNFVLGAPGGISAEIRNLIHMMDRFLLYSQVDDPDASWGATGAGYCTFDVASASLLLGGNVRTGMEDCIYFPDGSFSTNVGMVEKIVRIAEQLDREIADVATAREILGLSEEKKDRIIMD